MPYTDHTDPDTIQKFNEVAEGYDLHFSNRFDRAEENVLFERYSHLLQRADVLDIGCGTGLVAMLAYKQMNTPRLKMTPNSYTGIDVSEKMLEIAARRIKTPRSQVLAADMVDFMNHRCAPEEFDVVTSWYFPMNYCEHEPPQVYEAVARVLRPGGHFINIMASSRYVMRPSHIVEASNLRRFFEDNEWYRGQIPPSLNVVSITGFNFLIEKYRRWLNLCPQSVIEAMFRFDQIRGEKSGMKPYFYGIHLQKPSLNYEKTPLDM
ncbi:MAG TPA: methyltransferase domain-containing protein [Saprospiraceae bacterium]|nr:methyltransferase domain-containing protein [Saprospiraceae bacterium]